MPPSPAIAFRALPCTRTLLHFFSALPLGAPRRQKKRRRRWSTTHISRAAACCFVWLTRASPARVRCTQFCRALASLQVAENFLRLRRAARCEVTVRGRHAIACRRLNALCGIAFAGTTRAPVACPSALSSSCAASTAVACACVDTQDCQASQCRAGCGAPRTTAARAALFACGRRLLPPPGSFLYSMGAFFGRSRRALVGMCAYVFSRISPFERLKMRKIFWPRRGARSQFRELAL